MSAATDSGWGFEGPGVLEALLSEAGQPKPIEEVDRLLRAALQESLLPSEIVYRVVGKHARALPAPLVRRLASNLFALYASIGREVFEKTQTELLARAVRLQGLSTKARLDFLSHSTEEISPDSAGGGAPGSVRELPTEPGGGSLDQPARHPDEAHQVVRRGAVTPRMAQNRTPRRPSGVLEQALTNLREAEEALAALCQDLSERPSTKRLCMDAQSALSHLSQVIEGAVQVLKDETLLGA